MYALKKAFSGTGTSPLHSYRLIQKLSTSTMSRPVKVAVLDDYQGISEPKFKALDASKYDVSFFKDTLPPYNHPNTTQYAKDKLVTRLEPFTVICIIPSRFSPLSSPPAPPIPN